MIGILTLFGGTDLQPLLKKLFSQHDIFFVQTNAVTSVQLMTQLDEHRKESDVVIAYANALNLETLPELVEEIRKVDKMMRIVLILNGNSLQYMRDTLAEYRNMNIDIIFDDDGFDSNELLAIVEQGKLSHKDVKPKKRESGFKDDYEPARQTREKKPQKPKREKEQGMIYDTPDTHFIIGVMNAARGAGATTTGYNLARYFAIHNYSSCFVDMSDTGAGRLIKSKKVDVYTEDIDIDSIKATCNITVCDFGTPIEVSADGLNFKLNDTYNSENIHLFNCCNIKMIMGFSDEWNIEKIKFFLKNETWSSRVDNSYVYVVPNEPEKLKGIYPDFNILSRDTNLSETILEAVRNEEA